MTSTALGAETKKEEKIIFISDAHEKFYYEKLKEVRYQDVYHKALCYCLGISDDTRRNVYRIYDFKTGCVITECLHEGWQTSGSVRVIRMAFNLYCNGTPSVSDYEDAEEQVDECRQYTVEEILNLTEGNLATVSCLTPGAPTCHRMAECRTYNMWKGLDEMISDYFSKITLADLAAPEEAGNDYVI